MVRLLDLDFGAGGFKLLLDFFRFFLLAAFLELLRSALDELLRFSQAKAGDYATHFFNDGNLVGASISEDDVELSLLFNSGSRSSATSGSSSSRSSAPARARGLSRSAATSSRAA